MFCSPRTSRRPAGFSLIEVLIAIMILGVGLLMIAAVFPVAGMWTRQSAQENIAQSLAHTAVAIIQKRYGHNGPAADVIANTGGQTLTLAPVPQLTDIPSTERSYQFGSSTPFPSADAAKCTYFWTALIRSSTGSNSSPSYNLCILVFNKGSLEQTFSPLSNETPGVRLSDELYMPTLATITPDRSTVVRVGEYAFGQSTGTVYRRTLDSSGQPIFQPALDSADDHLFIAPPADGTSSSPLVYVYQTTIGF